MQKIYSFLLTLLLIILTVNLMNAQREQVSKSFIVQMEKGKILSSKETFAGLPAGTYTTRQICDEPMNLWLVQSSREVSELRQMYSELAPASGVVSFSSNRPLTLRAVPNDSLYNRQWQYNNTGANGGLPGADINAEPAWDITTGGVTPNGDTIVVAVVDDGLDIDHVDMAPNVWINKFEIPGDSIDNDNNGYIDDVNGWNVGSNDNDIISDGSHGTPVAGIVGARGNNEIGVTGVNWNVKIMPINYGSANEANALAAYAYAYKMRKRYNDSNGLEGAFVVATNSSWGIDRGKPEDAPLWCAMYDSLGKVGILSMGATANVNLNVDSEGDLPTGCASDYLIAVTNLDKTDKKVTSAGFGRQSVDLGAYGAETYTIATNNKYGSFGGTSGATPHVTGAVALMYAVPCNDLAELTRISPDKAALYVRDIILNSTKANASLENTTSTDGKLNLGNAAQMMLARCGACKVPVVIEDKIENYTNAIISWNADQADVIIRLRKTNQLQWDTISTSGLSSIEIANLDRCTQYEYQLGYQCTGENRKWSSLRFLTTEGCCYAPTSVEFTADSGAFVFNTDSGELINVIIRLKGDSFWDTLVVENNTRYENVIECSQYEAMVVRYCALFDVFSDPSEVQFLPSFCGNCTSFSYCRPAELDNGSEWIESIAVGGIEYITGQDKDGYGNQMGGFVPSLHRQDSVIVTFTPGFSGSAYSEFFTAYIDWNQDGEFSDDELFTKSRKADKNPFIDTIYVPEDALLGYTRMRITMAYREASLACSSPAEFGEAEDYCVQILGPSDLQETENRDIIVYPNPVQGQITIQGSQLSLYNRIAILDAGGRPVYSQTHKEGNTGATLPADLDLPAGYYTISLTGKAQKPLHFKLIVL